MKKIILLSFITISTVFAQEYGTGLILNDPLFETAPVSAPLMRGDYDNLPSSASVRQYAPKPGYQGKFGTCTGWAAAYAGRTILEASRTKLPKEKIDENSFSPSFVYNQIKTGNDCSAGASLIEALECLRNSGDVKMNEFGYDCSRAITGEDKLKAEPYRILEYREIAGRKTEAKHRFIRKSIAEGKPVVLAFDCPVSFNNASEVWTPQKSDYREWGRGHAITAVSYDDKKYGGAVELMNSWGTAWGKGGFTWIKYDDFNYFCKLAFEMIDKHTEDTAAPDLSGSLFFREGTGREMKSRFNGNYFVMEKSYPAGTLFELRITNYEPAYIYALSSDLTNKVYKIFPFTERMTAYLAYSQNNIAIPDEESFNLLDPASAVSYYCFLYSREPLDISRIITGIENAQGNFAERLNTVLSDKTVVTDNIDYTYRDGIQFTAKSRGRSVVPVIVQINLK